RAHHAHPHDRPGLHAARLQPRHRAGDQRVPRGEHLHPGARLHLRALAGRGRGGARGARRGRVEVFVLPAAAPELRPGHRLLARAVAAVLAVRHRRGGVLRLLLHHRHEQARPDGRAGRHPEHLLGSRHPAVLPHRHRALRPGAGRRIRRPHLPAGAPPAALPGAGGAGEGPLLTRAVVFGYGDIGVRGLSTLLAHGVDVPLVVTHKDDPNEARWYGSVLEFSEKRRLRVLADPPLEALDIGKPDLIFSFYYRSMLPMSLLGRARLGAFNMHGSLLPKYRGRAPLNWAILKGERETGVT